MYRIIMDGTGREACCMPYAKAKRFLQSMYTLNSSVESQWKELLR